MQQATGYNPASPNETSQENPYTVNINQPQNNAPEPVQNASPDPMPVNSYTTNNNGFPPEPPKKKRSIKKMFLTGGLSILFILIFATITTAVLAAYNKITLPNPYIHELISYYVINLPFMPKTPKYVLTKAAMTHAQLSSAYLKTTLATDSNDLKRLVGLDSLDFKVEGPIDYNDRSNPKIALNVLLTDQLDADFKVIDKVLYFKLNKIPEIAYTYVGLNENNLNNNPVLNKWVSYDLKKLESEDLKENVSTKPDGYVEETLLKIVNSNIVPKLKMSADQYDGKPAYKVELPLTQKELAELQKEFSDLSDETQVEMQRAIGKSDISFIKDFKITLWIDQSTTQLRKSELVFTIYNTNYENTLQVLGASTIADTAKADFVSVNWTVLLSDLGKDFISEIQKPTTSTDLEKYMQEVEEFYMSVQSGVNNSSEESDDYEGFGEADTSTPTSLNVSQTKAAEINVKNAVTIYCAAIKQCLAENQDYNMCNSYAKLRNVVASDPKAQQNIRYQFTTNSSKPVFRGTIFHTQTRSCLYECAIEDLSVSEVTASSSCLVK